jgi:hypothetical protein
VLAVTAKAARGEASGTLDIGDRDGVTRFQHPRKIGFYPYSEHRCAHRQSHDFGKLFGGRPETGVVVRIIPLDVQRRCEKRWALDFPGRRNRSPLEISGQTASRSRGLTRAKEKPTGVNRRANRAGPKSAPLFSCLLLWCLQILKGSQFSSAAIKAAKRGHVPNLDCNHHRFGDRRSCPRPLGRGDVVLRRRGVERDWRRRVGRKHHVTRLPSIKARQPEVVAAEVAHRTWFGLLSMTIGR